jgi:predicted short-subunit dehydrogenase-like oxidoreductase (DUF2520 family)
MEKITIVGAGNVASHLIQAFADAHITVYQHATREGDSTVKAYRPSCKPADIDTGAEIVILAVSDNSIPHVTVSLPEGFKGLLVHTSGAIPMGALGNRIHKGVFYPLQTFSKGRAVDYKNIPLFLEAENTKDLNRLKELAQKVFSPTRVTQLTSDKRKKLHVAAVFVCNFVNHMYTIGAEIMEDGDMDFDLLRPLIQETAQKVQTQSPKDAQTGPARRGDHEVINEHLDMLDRYNEEEDVYRLVTQSILKRTGR